MVGTIPIARLGTDATNEALARAAEPTDTALQLWRRQF
jgi:hypothetical protein